jgi:hypothetical protein
VFIGWQSDCLYTYGGMSGAVGAFQLASHMPLQACDLS